MAASTRGGDGVRHARERRHDRRLSHAAHPVRVQRIWHLDDHCVDHREIRRHRHAVVEEARVLDHTVLVEDVLLVERPSDPLGRTALHLALDVARVDGFAGVLNGRVAEHRDPAGFWIDLDVTHVCRESGAGHGCG